MDTDQTNLKLAALVAQLLDADSETAKTSLQALIKYYQLLHAQFYTNEQKDFLRHYATNYADAEKTKFDTSVAKGLVHQLYQTGYDLIKELYPNATEEEQTQNYLVLHAWIDQILGNDEVVEMVKDFNLKKTTAIVSDQVVMADQLADDVIDYHHRKTPDITSYLEKLSHDQVQQLGRNEIEIARAVRERLGVSVPSVTIPLFQKLDAPTNFFHNRPQQSPVPVVFSQSYLLFQPLFIALMRKLLPADLYPANLSWDSFIKTQRDRAASPDVAWGQAPSLPGLSAANLYLPSTVNGLSFSFSFLDASINAKDPRLVGISLQLDRLGQKRILLEADRLWTSGQHYADKSFETQTYQLMDNQVNYLAHQINAADFLDTILFKISQVLPPDTLNRDRKVESLLQASRAVRDYLVIGQLRSSIDNIKAHKIAMGEKQVDDEEIFFEADEQVFHPDQKPTGLIDNYDVIQMLSTNDDFIVEHLLKGLGVQLGEKSWADFKNSAYWQNNIASTKANIFFATMMPGMELVIDSWTEGETKIGVRINRDIRKTMLFSPARPSLFGFTNAVSLDKSKQQVQLLEEEIEHAQKSLPNIKARVRAPGIMGWLGQKIDNPEYVAVRDSISQKQMQLDQLKQQIITIS